jgi:hypothetical protein
LAPDVDRQRLSGLDEVKKTFVRRISSGQDHPGDEDLVSRPKLIYVCLQKRRL